MGGRLLARPLAPMCDATLVMVDADAASDRSGDENERNRYYARGLL